MVYKCVLCITFASSSSVIFLYGIESIMSFFSVVQNVLKFITVALGF